MAKRERITFWLRLSCVLGNWWYGICAPFEGGLRGTMYGLNLAPKLSTFMNLLTGYIVPAAFGGTLGAIGFVCGCVACVGSFAEGLRQFVAPEPYSRPISSLLVDWMPRGF